MLMQHTLSERHATKFTSRVRFKTIFFTIYYRNKGICLYIITFLFYFFSSCFCFSFCENDTPTLFTSLDENNTGINFQNTFFDDGPLNVANYIYFYNGGGVAIGDINNDGLPGYFFYRQYGKNRLVFKQRQF